MAHVHACMALRDVQVKCRPLRHNRHQPQPRRVHVVARALYHQPQRCLGDAILPRNLPLNGHEIPIPILVVDDGHLRLRLRRRGGRFARGDFLERLFVGLRLHATPREGKHQHKRRRACNEYSLDIRPRQPDPRSLHPPSLLAGSFPLESIRGPSCPCQSAVRFSLLLARRML